jgi:hypothetical protein
MDSISTTSAALPTRRPATIQSAAPVAMLADCAAARCYAIDAKTRTALGIFTGTA